MNSRELRAMRKDKAAHKFDALAAPAPPPVELDDFFARSDFAYEARKDADCANFGRLSADRATSVELARDPRGGFAS